MKTQNAENQMTSRLPVRAYQKKKKKPQTVGNADELEEKKNVKSWKQLKEDEICQVNLMIFYALILLCLFSLKGLYMAMIFLLFLKEPLMIFQHYHICECSAGILYFFLLCLANFI